MEPVEIDKSKYFRRAVIYTRRKDQVVLVDMNDATASPPLDPWLGKVYLLADGQHTIKELESFVAAQYQGKAPQGLSATIDSVVIRLLEAKIIELSDEPVQLPYYLSIPADDQDSKLATKLMLEDGYMSKQSDAEA